MAATLGFGFIFLAFLVSLYAIFSAIFGLHTHSLLFVESGRLAIIIVFPLLSLSLFILLALLLGQQYQFTAVYLTTRQDMSWPMRLSALWNGSAGSLLFFTWLCSGAAALSLLRAKQKELATFTPWVVIVTAGVLLFLSFNSLFLSNPFERLWLAADNQVISSFLQPSNSFEVVPTAGIGLAPALRNLYIELFTPALFTGIAIFLVPFAYSTASLACGFQKKMGANQVRRWVLAGWMLISAALFCEFQWTYLPLGQSRLWNWSSNEMAVALPWLTSITFLHTAILSERGNRHKRLLYVLMTLTFSLGVLAVFFIRASLFPPENSLNQLLTGLLFLVLTALILGSTTGLLIWRWKNLSGKTGLRSLSTREAFFLAASIVIFVIFLLCVGAMLYLTGNTAATTTNSPELAPWYRALIGALFAFLLALMGIAPLSSWGATTGRPLFKIIWKPFFLSLLVLVFLYYAGVKSAAGLFALWLISLVFSISLFDLLRSFHARRRESGSSLVKVVTDLFKNDFHQIGANLVHLGMVLITIGMIGSEYFQTMTEVSLSSGQEANFSGYIFHFEGVKQNSLTDGKAVVTAVLNVNDVSGNQHILLPGTEYFPRYKQFIPVPGIWRTITGDLYVILESWQMETADTAVLKLYFNPLILWLWVGIAVFIIGGLITFLPNREAARIKGSFEG